MRIVEISSTQAVEHPDLQTLAPPRSPAPGERASFLWIAVTRDELRSDPAPLLARIASLGGAALVELHVSDLLNEQLPSRYDFTSDYDLLVFRRLSAGTPGATAANAMPRRGPPALRRIDTRPIGFAVFDRVLLSVHPQDVSFRDAFIAKLLATPAGAPHAAEGRANGSRLPATPADLTLRLVSQVVDGYLDLRRELSRQLDHWQEELIHPRARFTNWRALMESRQALRRLGEVCEDQSGAIQDWMDALETLPEAAQPQARREQELLLVRGRDVLEHIERVARHVQRLEADAETAVQMHFNIQSHRTNDIMRVLTVLTAVFLPLNLIAGIFGMNFDSIPLLHSDTGFWIAMGAMALIALALVLVFWRKRYLARTR